MTKISKETDLAEGIIKMLSPAFEKAEKAKPILYKDLSGHEYMRCAGAYNDIMHRHMADDMFKISIIYMDHTTEISKKASTWRDRFNELNYTILRMIDDKNGNRPLIEFNFDDSKALIEEMTILKKELNTAIPSEKLRDVAKERLDIWVDSLFYMERYVYYLYELEEIDDILIEASLRTVDMDDNMITGESLEDENFVKTLCIMRKSLLEVFLKIPAYEKEAEFIWNKLRLLDIVTKAVMEGKMDKLKKEFIEKVNE